MIEHLIHISCCIRGTNYKKDGALDLSYSLALVHFIFSLLVWAEIGCTVTLSKRYINWFQPVHQSRQQVLRAYCPDIYAVISQVGGGVKNCSSNTQRQV